MSSIFTGQSALRHQFSKQTFTNLVPAVDAANAVLLHKFNQAGRLTFIDNTLDATAVLLLVHPDADSTVAANRLYWIEVPSNRVINYGSFILPVLEFDPGSKIFVYTLTVPTQGFIAIASWG